MSGLIRRVSELLAQATGLSRGYKILRRSDTFFTRVVLLVPRMISSMTVVCSSYFGLKRSTVRIHEFPSALIPYSGLHR